MNLDEIFIIPRDLADETKRIAKNTDGTVLYAPNIYGLVTAPGTYPNGSTITTTMLSIDVQKLTDVFDWSFTFIHLKCCITSATSPSTFATYFEERNLTISASPTPNTFLVKSDLVTSLESGLSAKLINGVSPFVFSGVNTTGIIDIAGVVTNTTGILQKPVFKFIIELS